MPSCSVPGCQSGATAYSEEKVQLFGFPDVNQRPKIRQEWIDQLGRRGWKPTENSRVCRKHFKDDSFEENIDAYGRPRKTLKLKPRAIPTEYLTSPPPQISNLKKKKEEQEKQRPGPSNEHNYAPNPGISFFN